MAHSDRSRKRGNSDRIKSGHKTETHSEPVRCGYDQHGLDQYYAIHGADYRNPHEKIIQKILKSWLIQEKRSTEIRVLDLACGSGEISLILRDYGVEKITGVDPYTAMAYQKRTGLEAIPYTFQQITHSGLVDDSGERLAFDLIICSFALHLCEKSRLPALCLRLAEMSPNLVVITPHKRPEISENWGWLMKSELIMDRVRLRDYQRRAIPS